MGAGRGLATWGKRGKFTYVGDLARGLRIKHHHGEDHILTVALLAELIEHFRGTEVKIGLGFRPSRGSLGSWLHTRTGIAGLAGYVGPILVAEGVAERVSDHAMRFYGEAA